MTISVTCPACGRKLKAPENAGGRTLNCPKCKTPIEVPPLDRLEEEPETPAFDKTQYDRSPRIDARKQSGVSRFVKDSLLPGERVVHIATLHPIIIIVPALLLVVTLIGFAKAKESQLPSEVITPLIFLNAYFFFSLLVNIIVYKTSDFCVTNKRILLKTGFIWRRSVELLLSKVESITVDQGILGRILDYGTIGIGGTGGSKEKFRNIADPLKLRQHVQAQIEVRG